MPKTKQNRRIEVDYEDLVVYANKRIKEEYKTISEFAQSQKAKELKDGKGNSLPCNIICNYLSIPKSGVKKTKNFNFMAQLYKQWNIELAQKKEVLVKISITTDTKLV